MSFPPDILQWDHVSKSHTAFTSGRSKVICGILVQKEGDPGDRASLDTSFISLIKLIIPSHTFEHIT